MFIDGKEILSAPLTNVRTYTKKGKNYRYWFTLSGNDIYYNEMRLD
jgi:hypothetical protein